MRISAGKVWILILSVFYLSFASSAPSFPYAGSFTPAIRERRKVIDERIAEGNPGRRSRGKKKFTHNFLSKLKWIQKVLLIFL